MCGTVLCIVDVSSVFGFCLLMLGVFFFVFVIVSYVDICRCVFLGVILFLVGNYCYFNREGGNW